MPEPSPERNEDLSSEDVLTLAETGENTPPRPGTKRAVRRHVGALSEEGDLEEVLAGLAAIREAEGGESGG